MLVLAIAAALALPDVAAGEFSHVEVRDVSVEVGTPPGLRTWRLEAIFANDEDIILAVLGLSSVPVIFRTNDPAGLFNDGGSFSGQKQEDFAFAPIAPAYDSWITMGATALVGNDCDYSPEFLGSDGVNAFVVGTSWFDTEGGWFDSEPGTQESGPVVAIAQFTVGELYGVRLSGLTDYREMGGGSGPDEIVDFLTSTPNFRFCPPDVDGDGDVGFPDLLEVLSLWGPCDGACSSDLDFDEVVGFQDLLIVLSWWGPCPGRPGACCLPDGTCRPAELPDGLGCTMEGGVYQGVDTTCAGVTCPPPAACCLPDGTCTPRFAAECAADGGTPQGDGTHCADVACAQPACPFAAGVHFDAGTKPRAIALGDVDGDGDEDLLVANQFDDHVLLLSNDGSGAFTPGGIFPVGDSPRAVAAGDLDGDGDLDLVTANHGDDTVSVRLNDGGGSYPGGRDYDAGTRPSSVAVGDLDGDLDLDLAVANSVGNDVSVLLNHGDGTFASSVSYEVGSFSTLTAIVMGDLNGDLAADLVVLDPAGRAFKVLLNLGAGTFGEAVAYVRDFETVAGLAVGDLDGDGDLDLTVARIQGGSSGVRVELNDGSGRFTENGLFSCGPGPYAVVIGDVDGDLDQDVLTVNRTGGTVSRLRNHGDGTFAPWEDFGAGALPVALALGDLDGDLFLDLAVANYAGDDVTVRLNECGPEGLARLPGVCVDP